MEAVKAFNLELSSLYEQKPPVSKAKMTSITKGAIKAIKLYKHVVQSVEKFIEKCRPEYKIPGLYIIDSIVRQSRHQFGPQKDVFAPRFAKNLRLTFHHLYKCNEEDKSKVIRVLNLWQKNNVFSSEVIQPLFDLADPNSGLSIQIEAEVRNKKKPNSNSNVNISSNSSNTEASDPEVIQQLQSILASLKSNVPNPKETSGFKKHLLDFDYSDEEDNNQDNDISQETLETLRKILNNTLVLDRLKSVGAISDHQIQQLSQLIPQHQNQQAHHQQQQNIHHMQQPHQPPPPNFFNAPDTDMDEGHSDVDHNDHIITDDDVDDDIVEIVHESKSESRRRGRSPRSRSRERKRSRRSRSREHRRRSRSREDREDREKRKEREKKGLPPTKSGHLSVCSTTLWVGHLSKLVSEEDLSDLFGSYGTVETIHLIPPRGCAFVCMNRRMDAAKALKELHRHRLQSKAITLAWAPGKGMKDKQWKDYWDVELGVSYIPIDRLDPQTDMAVLEEGSTFDQDTMPEWMKTMQGVAPSAALPIIPATPLLPQAMTNVAVSVGMLPPAAQNLQATFAQQQELLSQAQLGGLSTHADITSLLPPPVSTTTPTSSMLGAAPQIAPPIVPAVVPQALPNADPNALLIGAPLATAQPPPSGLPMIGMPPPGFGLDTSLPPPNLRMPFSNSTVPIPPQRPPVAAAPSINPPIINNMGVKEGPPPREPSSSRWGPPRAEENSFESITQQPPAPSPAVAPAPAPAPNLASRLLSLAGMNQEPPPDELQARAGPWPSKNNGETNNAPPINMDMNQPRGPPFGRGTEDMSNRPPLFSQSHGFAPRGQPMGSDGPRGPGGPGFRGNFDHVRGGGPPNRFNRPGPPMRPPWPRPHEQQRPNMRPPHFGERRDERGMWGGDGNGFGPRPNMEFDNFDNLNNAQPPRLMMHWDMRGRGRGRARFSGPPNGGESRPLLMFDPDADFGPRPIRGRDFPNHNPFPEPPVSRNNRFPVPQMERSNPFNEPNKGHNDGNSNSNNGFIAPQVSNDPFMQPQVSNNNFEEPQGNNNAIIAQETNAMIEPQHSFKAQSSDHQISNVQDTNSPDENEEDEEDQLPPGEEPVHVEEAKSESVNQEATATEKGETDQSVVAEAKETQTN